MILVAGRDQHNIYIGVVEDLLIVGAAVLRPEALRIAFPRAPLAESRPEAAHPAVS